MSRLREIVHQLSSRIRVIWLSVLSWMHWSQRKRERQQQEWKDLLYQIRLQQDQLFPILELQQRRLLVEAMRPLAEALHRQDSLRSQQQAELRELLLEVLNSLQPTAAEQIYPRIGQPPQRSSSPSLAS